MLVWLRGNYPQIAEGFRWTKDQLRNSSVKLNWTFLDPKKLSPVTCVSARYIRAAAQSPWAKRSLAAIFFGIRWKGYCNYRNLEVEYFFRVYRCLKAFCTGRLWDKGISMNFQVLSCLSGKGTQGTHRKFMSCWAHINCWGSKGTIELWWIVGIP
jgi:hypothetical protein